VEYIWSIHGETGLSRSLHGVHGVYMEFTWSPHGVYIYVWGSVMYCTGRVLAPIVDCIRVGPRMVAVAAWVQQRSPYGNVKVL